ncbi:hypothetical protein D3C84_1263640 [compost metagenome]
MLCCKLDAQTRHQFETRQRRSAEAGSLVEQGQRIVNAFQAGKGDLMAARLRKQF